jgi:hypothetical protein
VTALDYQLDYNGTILGDGTAWEITSWGGLEEFTTRGSDVPFPTAYGSIPGSSYVDAKVVTIVAESVDPANMLLLEAALLPPANSTPDSLVAIRSKFPNREEFLMYGRCSRRMRTRDITSTLGMTQMVIELEFPDPRIYSAVLQQASLTVFVAGSLALDFTVGAGADLALEFTVGIIRATDVDEPRIHRHLPDHRVLTGNRHLVVQRDEPDHQPIVDHQSVGGCWSDTDSEHDGRRYRAIVRVCCSADLDRWDVGVRIVAGATDAVPFAAWPERAEVRCDHR